jgi:amidophosphoribosyltransferase
MIKNNIMIEPFFQTLFNPNLNDLNDLHSSQIGIAHTRYKTIGPCTQSASQPLLSPDRTLCLAHNGQIDVIDWFPDSGYILDYMIKNLQINNDEEINKINKDMIFDHVFRLVEQLMNNLVGSYSCVTLVANVGLVAFRDPRGIRPLILGKNANDDYIVASESVCIDSIPGFSILRDIQPGECVIINPGTFLSKQLFYDLAGSGGTASKNGGGSMNKYVISSKFTPCIFEYIYLASPRSIIDGLSVEYARKNLGYLLAHHINLNYADLKIDMVVPVPESSKIATMSMAERLNDMSVEYVELLELNSNREKARSFILPTQELREEAVARKFILSDKYDLTGKNILIVDDSIIRGTTLRHIVAKIRSGSKCNQIYVASVAPPIINHNIYGIDIPDCKLLIAHNRSNDQIAKEIGADLVIYQKLNSMLEMFALISPTANSFEHSMFRFL